MQGGGAPNAIGPMHDFYSAPTTHTVVGAGPENFAMTFDGTPFVYDPAQGNLLMEIYITNLTSGITISRCAGSAEASRAYHRHTGVTGNLTAQAHRTQFTLEVVSGSCYANCDGSTVEPVLNVGDFTCFLQQYAAGESYANCDQSTEPPVLNVGDFTCFLQQFATGCP
jgi:hypothetical protein